MVNACLILQGSSTMNINWVRLLTDNTVVLCHKISSMAPFHNFDTLSVSGLGRPQDWLGIAVHDTIHEAELAINTP
jgi:hypothetical protein